MKTIRMISIGLCVTAISACMSTNDSYTGRYQMMRYPSISYQTSEPVMENYYVNSNDSYPEVYSGRRVTVPNSYYVGETHAPVSARDKDSAWVSSQNPSEYTIEIADDAKASAVAKKLYQTPKTDRTAEIKYERQGQVYYKGLYGTYKNQEDARKALNALPDDVKAGAGIKNWSSVQGH